MLWQGWQELVELPVATLGTGTYNLLVFLPGEVMTSEERESAKTDSELVSFMHQHIIQDDKPFRVGTVSGAGK